MFAARTSIALLVVLMLTGCTALAPYAKEAVDQAASASDSVRETAEFALCRAITIGAWMRAYGHDPERADAWRKMCTPRASEQLPS